MSQGRTRVAVPPFRRLGSGRRGRFGRRAHDSEIKWLPWASEETWEVSLAYVQHLLAMALNEVIAGTRPVVGGLNFGSTQAERFAGVVGHCNMTAWGLRSKLAGRRALSASELWAWVSIVGIDVLPVAVSELLPPSRNVLSDPT